MKTHLRTACAALAVAGTAMAESDLPSGSCIYSGSTNRASTASSFLTTDIDFAASSLAWKNDLSLDAFAFLKATQTLLRFRSDERMGLFLIVR